MAHCWIYMLDRASRILTGSDVACESDESAFAWTAATPRNDARAEAWQGTRCLVLLSSASFPLTTQADRVREGDRAQGCPASGRPNGKPDTPADGQRWR
jgi:hypothetical protein